MTSLNIDINAIYYVLLALVSLWMYPVVFMIVHNFTASFGFYLYKIFHKNDVNIHKNPRLFWERPVAALAKYWNVVGSFLHGTYISF